MIYEFKDKVKGIFVIKAKNEARIKISASQGRWNSEIANINAGARKATNQILAISKIQICQDQ